MTFKVGARIAARKSSLKRFESCDVDPARVRALHADHVAVATGRTLFPSTVVAASDSARLLVSGHNSRKLGARIDKGPWRGLPLYHLTLEERATCPRSCARWGDCYGNAMHMARRHDHRDPLFLDYLAAELLLLHREHKRFAVRLHTLGDFYSLDYVRFWADQLDRLPGLRVFGYTARSEDDDDAESRRIAQALRWLAEQAFDVFALRFSGRVGPMGAVTVRAAEEARGAILCPAQTHKTDACATCGLCWAPAARDKAIAFLLHGMKAPTGPRKGRARTWTIEDAQAWRVRYDAGASVTTLESETGRCATVIKAALKASGAVIRGRAEAIALAQKTSTRGRSRSFTDAEARAWRSAYEGGVALHDIAARARRGLATVRRGVIAAGGTIRTRREAALDRAVAGHMRKAAQSAALQAMPPRAAAPPSTPSRGFALGARPPHTRAKLSFSPGEQQRLIAEALAQGRLTACPPAPAFGAERAGSMLGKRAK